MSFPAAFRCPIRASLLTAVFSLSSLFTAGCQVGSNPETARTTTTVSDPAFMAGLDRLTQSGTSVLICVCYWNNWEAILRDSNTGKYRSFGWNGKAFEESDRSVFLRGDMEREIFDHLQPLGSVYRKASVDYGDALERNKQHKMMNFMLHYLPTPSLMAIDLRGTVRPIWVVPYRIYPNEGPAAILADDGSVLKSVKCDRDGLRERRWWE